MECTNKFLVFCFDKNLYINDWQRIELGSCILSYWYGKNGEQIFVKVHELWYGSVVYPMVGILILIVLILLGVYFYQSRRQMITQ